MPIYPMPTTTPGLLTPSARVMPREMPLRGPMPYSPQGGPPYPPALGAGPAIMPQLGPSGYNPYSGLLTSDYNINPYGYGLPGNLGMGQGLFQQRPMITQPYRGI